MVLAGLGLLTHRKHLGGESLAADQLGAAAGTTPPPVHSPSCGAGRDRPRRQRSTHAWS